MNQNHGIPFGDPRLAEAGQRFEGFLEDSRDAKVVGIVYHGDTDGAVGAAFVHRAIARTLLGVEVQTYWVATEEYDFDRLATWTLEAGLDRCVILDISIANKPSRLEQVAASVRGVTFIFDHHLANSDVVVPANVVLCNPTLVAGGDEAVPIPTFLFAYEVSRRYGLTFPNWLLMLCVFSEGVDGFYGDGVLAIANREVGFPKKGSLRERYRASPLSRAASLLRAAFSIDKKSERGLTPLITVADGKTDSLGTFLRDLESEYGQVAESITTSIDALVRSWTRILRRNNTEDEDALVVIPIDGSHAVASPVASILRGTFPHRVIMTWVRSGDRAVFELRARNGGPLDLVWELKQISERVQLRNFGGHRSAAGGALDLAYLEEFSSMLRKNLQLRFQELGLRP